MKLRYVVLTVAVLFLMNYYWIFDGKLDLNGDNVHYWLLSRALHTGKGYVDLITPGTPPHTQYPPGYPWLLSAFKSINTAKALNGIFFAFLILTSGFFFYVLTENGALAVIAAAFIAFNPTLLRFSTIMMPEIPFTLLSVLTLLILVTTENPIYRNIEYQAEIPPEAIGIIAGVLAGLSCYFKMAGVALIGTGFIYLLLKREIRAACLFILISGAIVFFWLKSNPTSSGYIPQLFNANPYVDDSGTVHMLGLLQRVKRNLWQYLQHAIPDALLPFRGMSIIAGLPVLLFALYGIRMLPKGKMLLSAYLGAWFGMIFLWPAEWAGTRFLVPVIPVLLFLIVNTLNKVVLENRQTLGLFVPLLFYFVGIYGLHQLAASEYPYSFRKYFTVANWVMANTEEDTVIACRKTRLFALHSGRKCVNYPFVSTTEAFVEGLKARGANYLVVDELSRNNTLYLMQAIRLHPEAFEPVLSVKDTGTALFKVR